MVTRMWKSTRLIWKRCGCLSPVDAGILFNLDQAKHILPAPRRGSHLSSVLCTQILTRRFVFGALGRIFLVIHSVSFLAGQPASRPSRTKGPRRPSEVRNAALPEHGFGWGSATLGPIKAETPPLYRGWKRKWKTRRLKLRSCSVGSSPEILIWILSAASIFFNILEVFGQGIHTAYLRARLDFGIWTVVKTQQHTMIEYDRWCQTFDPKVSNLTTWGKRPQAIVARPLVTE